MSESSMANQSGVPGPSGSDHSSYRELSELAEEIALLASSASVLGWDQETYMPSAALDWRARQVAHLSGRAHELTVSERRCQLLEKAAEDEGLDPVAAGNVREWRRELERDRRIPAELVRRRSEMASRARSAWAEARRQSDFSMFAPHLKGILELQLEMAERWGYPDEPYDALLEGYERGLTTADVSDLFGRLEPELREIARQAVERSERASIPEMGGQFSLPQQGQFNREVAAAYGFDFERGRIDATTHPFCTSLGPRDVRLTTRYRTDDFTESLYCVLHETGHGIYEQGLPQDQFGTPAGSAASLGIHESQSRLWENHVGRSRPFWERWLPRAHELFPALPDCDMESWMAMVCRAQPSFIRVDADESGYDLHIVLRFRLECELLRGELEVDDVPARWNELFEEFFGCTPPDDARGCLQDIHWSMGGFGYFPTYTLGNLVAAQLFSVVGRDHVVKADLERGKYESLREWLGDKVHRRGGLAGTGELVREVTGEDLDPNYHLAHLRRRYLGVDE